MEAIIPQIVELVILIIAVLLGRYIIPWIKAKLDIEQLSMAIAYAQSGVAAAEQILYGKGLGDEKLQYVTEWLSKELPKLGIRMSDESIRVIIEEAVKTMNEQSEN